MSNEQKPYSILFIEDEDDIRKKYITYFQKWFKEVYEAKDGEEAYKIYKEKKPHILIIDINLPKLNGLELLKKIREKDHTTKAIMLTAHSDTHYLLSATELKLTKYLVKPITRVELKEALNLAMEELDNFNITSKRIVNLKDNYYWNVETSELYNNNQLISLTNNETKIAEILFSNINQTITYDNIILYVWEDNFERNFLDTLKSTIKNLRKKLPENSIKNIFGLGYRIENS
ncbi:response regulator transcription factor [Arcobacter sp.]|uniref:response regulator transcription factor n=1 Tax=Arcobacter sp. TaxID=1872629 RepID=UPI003D104B9C